VGRFNGLGDFFGQFRGNERRQINQHQHEMEMANLQKKEFDDHRTWQSAENDKNRAWQATENNAQRAHEAAENDDQRAHDKYIADLQFQFATMQLKHMQKMQKNYLKFLMEFSSQNAGSDAGAGFGGMRNNGPYMGNYGLPTGGYGSSMGNYGLPTGGYGSSMGGYGSSMGGFGQPTGGVYGLPSGNSGAYTSGNGQPWGGLKLPPTSYGSAAGYGSPVGGIGSPVGGSFGWNGPATPITATPKSPTYHLTQPGQGFYAPLPPVVKAQIEAVMLEELGPSVSTGPTLSPPTNPDAPATTEPKVVLSEMEQEQKPAIEPEVASTLKPVKTYCGLDTDILFPKEVIDAPKEELKPEAAPTPETGIDNDEVADPNNPPAVDPKAAPTTEPEKVPLFDLSTDTGVAKATEAYNQIADKIDDHKDRVDGWVDKGVLTEEQGSTLVTELDDRKTDLRTALGEGDSQTFSDTLKQTASDIVAQNAQVERFEGVQVRAEDIHVEIDRLVSEDKISDESAEQARSDVNKGVEDSRAGLADLDQTHKQDYGSVDETEVFQKVERFLEQVDLGLDNVEAADKGFDKQEATGGVENGTSEERIKAETENLKW
jgi:polyhydroxyalkanoate synthesis regulator phasin